MSETEAALTTLSERVEEQIARYRTEAEAGLCPALTERLASRWETCHRSLAEYLREKDLQPKAASDERGALARGLDRVLAWCSDGDDRTALLERLIEREKALAASVEEALSTASGTAVAPLREALACAEAACRALEDECRRTAATPPDASDGH